MSDEAAVQTDPDTGPCILVGEHIRNRRHSWLECPTRTGATNFAAIDALAEEGNRG
jgi:hypothetical protein